MKTGIARRLYRRRVIATKRVGQVQHVRIELRQCPSRVRKIKQDIVIATAQQNWPTLRIHPVQEMGV